MLQCQQQTALHAVLQTGFDILMVVTYPYAKNSGNTGLHLIANSKWPADQSILVSKGRSNVLQSKKH